MKIGILSGKLSEEAGGVERYVANLTTNLLRIDEFNNYYLVNFTSKYLKEKRNCHHLEVPYSKKELWSLVQGSKIDSVLRNFLRMFLGGMLLADLRSNYMNFLRHVVFPLELERIVDLDLIHAPTHFLPMFSSTEITIVTVHDLTALKYPHLMLPSYVRYMKSIFAKRLSKTDRIIAVSESTKKDLVQVLSIPEDRIKVIYHGIEPRFHPRVIPEGFLEHYGLRSPYILYVTGTIEPRKNIMKAVEAFRIAKRRGLSHTLVLTGRKLFRYKELEEFLGEVSSASDIRYLGFVPENDLPILYSGADVFFYPSLYEGFGLPLLEAMACGCPVVASNVSSIPEVVGKAGLLIDPFKSRDLAKAILHLAEDDAFRNELVKKGLGRAKLFTWRETARNTLELYHKLMA